MYIIIEAKSRNDINCIFSDTIQKFYRILIKLLRNFKKEKEEVRC